MRKYSNCGLAAAVAAAMALVTMPAVAAYPTRPVKMTILFGGTANTVGQLLAKLMSKELPVPAIPISRPGGGGVIGYSYVHSTAPDGYNIVFNSNSINTTAHLGTLPFDYKAFAPIAEISEEIPVLAVNSSSDWKSLKDLAEAVKSGKKKMLKVGISGKGSFTHLASVALFHAMGIDSHVKFISYGSGKAPVELLAGRIDAALQWPGQFVSYVQSGKLTVLASTGASRVNILPKVRTAKEQGYDVDISMWRGLAAPKGTPENVIETLQNAARKSVKSKQFIDASKNIGFQPAFKNHKAFGKLIAKDDKFYANLINKLGLGQ